MFLAQVVDALADSTDVVLRIDVQGAATVRTMMPEAVSIFLVAESEAKLVQRLVARKTEDMVRSAMPAVSHLLFIHHLTDSFTERLTP